MNYLELLPIEKLLIRLAISWLFVIGTAVSAADDSVIIHPTDEIVFKIQDERGPDFRVPLRKVDSYLANDNVPVWQVDPSQPEVLTPANEIMKAVGPTTMYQNSDLSAAAVYFHKSRKFYGTIDIRFVFNGVSIDRINEVIEIQYFHAPGLIARHPDLFGHRNSRSVENDDYQSPINGSEITGEKVLLNESQLAVRSRRDLTNIYYVKVLLIINQDVLNGIKSEFDDDIGIVHSLLALFNSVDMLYSKLQEPDVKINIAGIIIGTDYWSFPSFVACYKRTHLDINCINNALRKFLEKNSEVISPDSYNIPIFLTSYSVAMDRLFRTFKLEGLTSGGFLESYIMRKFGIAIGPIVSVHNQEYFGSFPVIAHEMAHALRVRGHDSGPFSDAGECCASLMKPIGLTCPNCLKWSAKTKKSLKKYFTSRERCFHIYKPPSLEKPGPRVIQTADAQCQCYGYESAGIPKKTVMNKLCWVPLKKKCETSLRCYDLYGGPHDAAFPLDGTPCSEDADGATMVCWAKKCVRIAKDEE